MRSLPAFLLNPGVSPTLTSPEKEQCAEWADSLQGLKKSNMRSPRHKFMSLITHLLHFLQGWRDLGLWAQWAGPCYSWMKGHCLRGAGGRVGTDIEMGQGQAQPAPMLMLINTSTQISTHSTYKFSNARTHHLTPVFIHVACIFTHPESHCCLGEGLERGELRKQKKAREQQACPGCSGRWDL